MMNKAGKGGDWFKNVAIGIMVLVVLMVGVGLFGGWFTPEQQIIPQQQQVQIKQISEEAKRGDAATVKFFAYDQDADQQTATVPVILYVQDSGGSFIIDGTSMSTSTRTSAATTIGEVLKFWGNNNTYYPQLDPYTSNGITIDPMNYKVEKESQSVDVWVYKIASGLSLYGINDDAFLSGTADGKVNITTAGSQTSSDISKFKVEVNGTNEAYNLGGFYVDTPTGDNTTDVDMKGPVSVSGIIGITSVSVVKSTLDSEQTERLGEKDDFIFEIDADGTKAGNQPLMLHESDFIYTSTVSHTHDGDTPTNDVNDWIDIYAFDKTCVRSYKQNKVICGWISNDADSPADIGAADIDAPRIYITT